MSPRKQPERLFEICATSCLHLINSACYVIEKTYPEKKFHECEIQAIDLKRQLMTMLPASLLDVLYSERTCHQYQGDPRIQLHVLTHPNMTVFRKCDLDNSIPQKFWIDLLPNFSHLLILDLKFSCTDEILQVIGTNCSLLQQVNIVSRVDIYKSHANTSVLIRNVSDKGLSAIANLKHLRVLAMDPPRNRSRCASKIGRHVSQAGIIMLIRKLPILEELQIESCDIGSTLIGSDSDLGPLNLRKVNCHFASAAGIRKLIKICPYLEELSVTHLSAHSKDDLLDEIAVSKLMLCRLDLSFFFFSDHLQQLLVVKGRYLTYFSLWEIEQSLTLDAVISIGELCPNLNTLCLMTQSRLLEVPRNFQTPSNIFKQLKNLTIGNENFNIHQLCIFFFECTMKMQKLVLKYQNKVNLDNIFLQLIDKGSLKSLNTLWLDYSLQISNSTVVRLIESCAKLEMLTIDFSKVYNDVQQYIFEHNLDLKLGSY